MNHKYDEAAAWLRANSAALAAFEVPSTEATVTQLGMTYAVTDDGFSEVDPFDRWECGLDGVANTTPWLCLAETELPPVESFDFI
jgi:hypothetical protein